MCKQVSHLQPNMYSDAKKLQIRLKEDPYMGESIRIYFSYDLQIEFGTDRHETEREKALVLSQALESLLVAALFKAALQIDLNVYDQLLFAAPEGFW